MIDDDLDKLERQMRRKLLLEGGSRVGSRFSEEEQRIADKLLGKSESQRLQNRRDNSRPFKPRPSIVVAEYFWVPPDGHIPGGWRIDVRQNGVVRNSSSLMDWAECLKVLARLERRGVKSKKIETERMKLEPAVARSKPSRPESKRKAILDELEDFKP